MSSSSQENVQNPFKTLKFLSIKPNNTFSFFMKSVLFIFTVLSIYLLFFYALSRKLHYTSCPQSQSDNRLCSHKKFLQPNITLNFHEEKTNVSHIVFGIGGSVKTWDDRRRYCELWWEPNVTRGFVWLDEEPNKTWPDTSPPYKVSQDTSMFKYTSWYGTRSAIRISRIVKETFELGFDNVRWFVLGDDDTVFFLENLITVLGKYDHNQMYYIGGNSESVEQDVIHSYTMAYGGGGFAISYPLAAELVRLLDGCIDRYASFYGSDQKVQGCMAEIGVPVTKELGFHQVDIRGDPYGLLAAHPLAPIVSLHHLDYVQPIFPNMTQIESSKKLMSAYKTDPNRAVQQSFCYDLNRKWSVSVAWGYVVQLYPYLENAKTLETAYLTFKSWRSWTDEPFTFNTRYLSQNPCERPIVYFLDRVQKVGEDRTLTTYKRVKSEFDKDCDNKDFDTALAVQYFEVTAPRLKPDIWKLAPRRQCCEVIHDKGFRIRRNKWIRIKIRDCSPFESVTPP